MDQVSQALLESNHSLAAMQENLKELLERQADMGTSSNDKQLNEEEKGSADQDEEDLITTGTRRRRLVKKFVNDEQSAQEDADVDGSSKPSRQIGGRRLRKVAKDTSEVEGAADGEDQNQTEEVEN